MNNDIIKELKDMHKRLVDLNDHYRQESKRYNMAYTEGSVKLRKRSKYRLDIITR